MVIFTKVGLISILIYCIVYMYCEPPNEEMEK